MNSLIPVLLLACSAAGADATQPFAGEIEDGSWAKYYVTVEGDNVNLVLETTIKAVGRTQEAGADCRWIEVGSVDTASGERMEVFKLLFRDSDLTRGGVNITNVVRSWILTPDSDQPIQASGEQTGALVLLFSGELNNERRPDESEKIDVQGQSLECGILEGETRAELGDQSITVTHRLLLHEDVPFGLAGFHKEVRFNPSGMKIVVDGRLLETGSDAVSLLPNSR